MKWPRLIYFYYFNYMHACVSVLGYVHVGVGVH